MKEQKQEKVDKIIQKYIFQMQLQMQRFANDILNLKFKKEDLK